MTVTAFVVEVVYSTVTVSIMCARTRARTRPTCSHCASGNVYRNFDRRGTTFGHEQLVIFHCVRSADKQRDLPVRNTEAVPLCGLVCTWPQKLLYATRFSLPSEPTVAVDSTASMMNVRAIKFLGRLSKRLVIRMVSQRVQEPIRDMDPKVNRLTPLYRMKCERLSPIVSSFQLIFVLGKNLHLTRSYVLCCRHTEHI